MKANILFVDDDPNVVNGLRRMLHSFKKEWNLFYALSGQEALEIISKESIDVIVTDLRMPGMSGAQLLYEIQKRTPDILRITLSGYSEEEMSIQSSRYAHQSLCKPTSPEKIKSTIEKAFGFRKYLKNESLIKLVNKIEKLPSLPDIYLRLEKEMSSANISLSNIDNIISKDPVITAKVIQLSNSAFFGLPVRITDINRAVNYLGINIIKNLVLTINLFRLLDTNNPNTKFYTQIWNHSNKVAEIVRKICVLEGYPKAIKDDAFLAGLLHDIGKLILIDEFDDYFKNVLEIMESEQIPFHEAEKKLLHADHTELGAYLLGIWGLPDSIVEAVALHHNNDFAFDLANPSPALIIKTANEIANEGTIATDDITEDIIREVLKTKQMLNN